MPFLSAFSTEKMAWLERIADPVGVETRKRILAWCLVFAAYLVTAQIGVYLYRDIGTSPALIWPPVGIALAAVLIEGYWIISAIAFAALVNALMSTVPVLGFIILGSVIANTIQPLVGGFLLRSLWFNPLMNSVRDAFLLVSVAGLATAIMPLTNYAFAIMHNVIWSAERQLPHWPEIWIGGALSAMVVTPLLARWIGQDFFPSRTRLQQLEALFSVFTVTTISFLLFATPVSPSFGTTLILLLIAALFWVAFRTGPRMMTLSLFLMTAISLAGAIYGTHYPSATNQTLAQRLISTELFDLIFCVVFFILVSVEEQRKEALKTLSREADELEKALTTIKAEDTAKNEFIATLAHELRNPLAPVISGLELLLMEETKPERTEILKSAQRQALVMRRLLDELLDVARITRRTFTLHKEDTSLNTLLEQTVQGVRYFFKERRHSFTMRLPKGELWVYGDQVRLGQVFSNILYNAGKYTEPGGTIQLTAEKIGDTVHVSISDNGIGIGEKLLEHVFEPFVQSRRVQSVGSGLGIGLSIAKRLIELHDGTIRAKSPGKNKGSTFTVELPLVKRQILMKEEPVESIATPSSVLVVDDNVDAAESIARLLKTRGHEVNVAYSGKDALAAMAKDPDVLLLDIGLPDMDGISVAKEVHEKNPRTAIIALSGYGGPKDKELAASAGIHTYLTKPASLVDLETAIAARHEAASSKREFSAHL